MNRAPVSSTGEPHRLRDTFTLPLEWGRDATPVEARATKLMYRVLPIRITYANRPALSGSMT